MDICFDVGNTTFVVGLYENGSLIKKSVFLWKQNINEQEYEEKVCKSLMDLSNYVKDIKRAIYSSVVPEVDEKVLPRLKERLSCPIQRVKESHIDLTFGKIDVNEVGDDLVADLVGLKKKYSYPSIIVDLGTASKVLLLDKNGVFDSCLIIPGLSMSIASLSSKAALLPDIDLKVPTSALAHNTVEAMNAGVILGHAEMIKGLLKRIENELGYSCKRILTGGSAIYLKDLLKDELIYDPDITLDGLEALLGGR